ncbi:MAG: hypothetical protein KJ749_09580, partial [Planctomycetes bacterium]|nr:hypothetical protein [Planctomycetota bacterium]
MYFSGTFLRTSLLASLVAIGFTPSAQGDVTYSTTTQFSGGTFINLNPNSDELQINTWAQTKTADPPVLPYLWVACSGRGTVVRIATADHYSPVDQKPVQAGDILGEYRAGPDACGSGPGFGQDPSRTTVDFDGNVWVANRANLEAFECEDDLCGHVVKIASGLAFQWVDRNCNGVLDTSTGLGDIRAWPNPDGLCTSDDVRFAQDELILLYQPILGTGTRTVAVDRENNVWIGGYDNGWHGLVDGQTGALLRDEGVLPCGGYGGVVDCHGVLWSARSLEDFDVLLRFDPNTVPPDPDCISIVNSYGLAVDTLGNIWNSQFQQQTVTKLCPAGGILGTFPSGGDGSRGVVVTPEDDDVWIANSFSNNVAHLPNEGQPLEATVSVGYEPTGVAVDSTGKIWVTNLSANNVARIDPVTNSIDLGPINLNLDPFQSWHGAAGPYNYSDMTGVNLYATIAPAGVWTVVADSGDVGTVWDRIHWAATIGAGTITVQARADNETYDLGEHRYIDIESNEALNCALTGQFLQIRVQLNTNCRQE